MGRKEKLLARLQREPRDFSWDELTRLLNALGYRAVKPGKTAGSRRKFLHPDRGWISLHQPHPGNVLEKYQITQIIDLFKREGIL